MRPHALLCLALAGCCGSSKKAPTRSVSNEEVAAAEAKLARTESQLAAVKRSIAAPTLAEAIAESRPLVGDQKKDPSTEAVVLANWLASHQPAWAALDAIPETTIGKAAKDVDEARGRRVCADGIVATIKRGDALDVKTYEGMLMSGGVIVKFLAVGNTGDLVAQSKARLCGIVTGLRSATGPYLVGMFDLSGRP